MKVGIIGTGLMGLPMAQRLLESGIRAIAYNRTPAKLAPLLELGATAASSPAELIKASEYIILAVTNAAAIKEVLLSDAAKPELAGRKIMQMGTISPTESKEIAQEVIASGGEYIEAPVLGSIPEAKAGKLIVMVGATPAQFDSYYSLLKIFGSEPIYIGEVGTASTVKLALNQLIASLTAAFALSLSLILRQNIDAEKFMNILRSSALYAPTFDKKLSRLLEQDWSNPNFPAQHLLKDTNLFMQEAQSLGLDVSAIAGVKAVLERAIAQGLAEADYSSLFAAINYQALPISKNADQ